MKNHFLLLITIIFLFSFKCYAQKAVKTNENKTKYVEIDVIKTYERIALKGYKSVDIFEKIGDSYYSNLEMEKAAKWYHELFAITSDLGSKYYYQYAESLRSIGKNDEANAILEKFNQKNKKQ